MVAVLRRCDSRALAARLFGGRLPRRRSLPSRCSLSRKCGLRCDLCRGLRCDLGRGLWGGRSDGKEVEVFPVFAVEEHRSRSDRRHRDEHIRAQVHRR